MPEDATHTPKQTAAAGAPRAALCPSLGAAMTGGPLPSALAQTRALRQAAAALGSVASASLTEDADWLSTVFDQLPDQVYVKDRQSRFIYANSATAARFGLDSVLDLVGKTDFDLFSPEIAEGFRGVEADLMARGEVMIDAIERIVMPDGQSCWHVTSKVPMRDATGAVSGLIGITKNITAKMRDEELRLGQTRLLEMIACNRPLKDILRELVLLAEQQLTDITASILLVDASGRHLTEGAAPHLPAAYNAAIEGVAIGPRVGSCGSAAFTGQPVFALDTLTDPHWADYRALPQTFGFRSCWSTPITTPDGTVLGTFALYSPAVRAPEKSELELIAMATHIARIAIERHRTEERIRFMAHHDALTGLPNRAWFRERMAARLSDAGAAEDYFTLVYVDLDNFKQINDSFGHAGGDQLLRTLAGRMRAALSPDDDAVRLGGDEFVLVFSHRSRHEPELIEELHRLRRALAEPVPFEGRRIETTCSLGIASFPQDGNTPEGLLASADAAMYLAKQLGRDTIAVCDESAAGEVPRPALGVEDLRRALGEGALFLDYQPRIDMTDGRILGVEALVRWRHAEHGIVPPAEFIGLAEESGLILPLGAFVLGEACRQAKAWQMAGLPPVGMAVNVSAHQFCHRDFTATLAAALAESGLEGRYLELELTESAVMADLPAALSAMRAARALGVHLSIDDFGTGYANLAMLRHLPVERIKIDRSFVETLPTDPVSEAIAAAVFGLARALNLSVVAEGVETEAQQHYLAEKGCAEGQGFLFARPGPPATIADRLARQG